MQERAVRLAMLVMVAMVMGSSPGHAAPSAQRRDPATVDLDALERDVVTEINRIRTDPKEFANVLAGLTSTPMTNARPYDIRLQFPDGEDSGESRAYLNSGIATARGLAPMKPLEWSAGLAKAAGDYAARNPQGHRDFGTTLGVGWRPSVRPKGDRPRTSTTAAPPGSPWPIACTSTQGCRTSAIATRSSTRG